VPLTTSEKFETAVPTKLLCKSLRFIAAYFGPVRNYSEETAAQRQNEDPVSYI